MKNDAEKNAELDIAVNDDPITKSDNFSKFQKLWRNKKREKNPQECVSRGSRLSGGRQNVKDTIGYWLKYRSLRFRTKGKPKDVTVKVFSNSIRKFFALNCKFCAQEIGKKHLISHCPVINRLPGLNHGSKRLSRLYQLSLALDPGD